MTPIYGLLHTFNRPQWQWLALPVVVSVAVVIWSAVGLGSYSGAGTPPMYGDFEAQRHWMEITQHLPSDQWYFYDLQWWGLDYPPLTAYHSWVIGKIGTLIDPSWFALDASRGFESLELQAYMRQSVLVSELIFYVPPVITYVSTMAKVGKLDLIKWTSILAIILLQPSLTLIDNGHFQYNAVMLGLFVSSLNCLLANQFLGASVYFVGALMFKQMALYYAPVIFAYLLGQCVFPQINILRLAAIGTTVIITFTLCLLPFLSIEQISQVAFRVFPFARGLWEDKVANLWCTMNTFVKLKLIFEADQLQKISLLATLLGILPACIASFFNMNAKNYRQSPRILVWAFAACAWSFYLFSFQVHEKSVLLPLLPTTLLLANGDSETNAMVYWVNNVAYFSMWPLLQRDGLEFQYFIILILWNWGAGALSEIPSNILNLLVVIGSYAAIAVLTLGSYFELIPMIDRYPDLLVVANITISFGSFVYFWLWLHTRLISVAVSNPASK